MSKTNILTKEKLIELYVNQLMSFNQIAKRFKLHSDEVRISAIKLGITLRPKRIFKPPTREEFIELYVNQRLSYNQISKLYGNCSKALVGKWRKEYGIDKIKETGKNGIARSTPLTDIQKEVICGLLLGDGCITLNKSKLSARLFLTHSEKQKEYLIYCHEFLKNLTTGIKSGKSKLNGKTHYYIGFKTLSLTELVEFEKIFYTNRIKRITKEILDSLTPLSIAIWLCDDGTLHAQTSNRIATDCFTYEEHLLIQKMFMERFGINTTITKINKNNKIYYNIYFSRVNSLLLSKLIEDYVPECMKYKLVDSNAPRKYKTLIKLKEWESKHLK